MNQCQSVEREFGIHVLLKRSHPSILVGAWQWVEWFYYTNTRHVKVRNITVLTLYQHYRHLLPRITKTREDELCSLLRSSRECSLAEVLMRRGHDNIFDECTEGSSNRPVADWNPPCNCRCWTQHHWFWWCLTKWLVNIQTVLWDLTCIGLPWW